MEGEYEKQKGTDRYRLSVVVVSAGGLRSTGFRCCLARCLLQGIKATKREPKFNRLDQRYGLGTTKGHLVRLTKRSDSRFASHGHNQCPEREGASRELASRSDDASSESNTNFVAAVKNQRGTASVLAHIWFGKISIALAERRIFSDDWGTQGRLGTNNAFKVGIDGAAGTNKLQVVQEAGALDLRREDGHVS